MCKGGLYRGVIPIGVGCIGDAIYRGGLQGGCDI